MDGRAYSEMRKILSPGYEVRTDHHPILQNLNHPLFTKLLKYTDQVIFILNHSTFEFLYVSENVFQVMGIPTEYYKVCGLKGSFDRAHPDDLSILQAKVFPEFYRCFDSLPDEQKLHMKSSLTFRHQKLDGTYGQYLQHNVPLTIENRKVILGFISVMDITPYKKNDRVTYKCVLINGANDVKILTQHTGANGDILTDREIQVLQLTANGMLEKEIANTLSLSLYTIKTHRKNMMKKTGAKNSAELVRFGMANLLI